MSSVHDRGPSVLMFLAGSSRRSRVEALDISTCPTLSMVFVEQFPSYYEAPATYFPAPYKSCFRSTLSFCEWLEEIRCEVSALSIEA